MQLKQIGYQRYYLKTDWLQTSRDGSILWMIMQLREHIGDESLHDLGSSSVLVIHPQTIQSPDFINCLNLLGQKEQPDPY